MQFLFFLIFLSYNPDTLCKIKVYWLLLHEQCFWSLCANWNVPNLMLQVSIYYLLQHIFCIHVLKVAWAWIQSWLSNDLGIYSSFHIAYFGWYWRLFDYIIGAWLGYSGLFLNGSFLSHSQDIAIIKYMLPWQPLCWHWNQVLQQLCQYASIVSLYTVYIYMHLVLEATQAFYDMGKRFYKRNTNFKGGPEIL